MSGLASDPPTKTTGGLAASRGLSEHERVELLAALIAGRETAREAWGRLIPDDLWRTAMRHGVAALAADALAACDAVPGRLRTGAREISRREIALDLVRESELRRMLAAFGDAKLPVLLLKGALLAYTHYRRPDLRPRLDTDLLIDRGCRGLVHDVLTSLGYVADRQAGAGLVTYQQPYVVGRSKVPVHTVDVHWRLVNPEPFRGVLSFEEMARVAVPVPRLHPAALGVSDVHALIVACLHRVAHHPGDDRLIWLYDIHLIASRFQPDQWCGFAKLAADRQVRAICQSSLQRAAAFFGTPLPGPLWSDRLSAPASHEPEPGAAYLDPRRRRASRLLDDLRALTSWAERWRLVRAHVLPPVDYMRQVYAPSSRVPLPVLYVQRVLAGTRKWFVRP
jgi:hypothetical protein